MGLFKSKEERRIERDMKLKAGLRAIERQVRQQKKFADDFVKNAQHARKIGDEQQYAFVRNALKRTAGVQRMLERQMLAMKNAMVITQQAQANWERAMAQAGSIEERMDLFLDSIEGAPTGEASNAAVTDDEIDRMINADVLAAEKTELSKLDELESEIAKELGQTKQRD